MVNQQLRDYISEQLHVGVSKEAVKGALLESGWAEADVNEAMLLEAGGTPSTASVPSSVATQPAVKVTQPVSTQPASVSTQPARVASVKQAQTSAPATADIVQPKVTIMAKTTQPVQPVSVSVSAIKPVTIGASIGATVDVKPARPSRLPMIIMVILFLVASTVAVFFYMQMSTLREQIDTASVQDGTTQKQVTGLSAERDSLASQVATLSAEKKDFTANLSLFVATEGATGDQTISLGGTLMAPNTKGFYALKTSIGAIVTVKNSKDAKVGATLNRLVGTNIQISGTHVAGSADVTVLTVNGESVEGPLIINPVPTSTTSSTAPTR